MLYPHLVDTLCEVKSLYFMEEASLYSYRRHVIFKLYVM